MNKTIRPLIVITATVALALLLCPATTQAQTVITYYGAAPSCGVTAPVAVTAYRPAYRPLFPRISWRRWARWNSWFRPAAVATPVTVAGYGNSCSTTACYAPCTTTCYKPQQSCRYVAQTCYRTQYCSVPVTTYRPVTTCDPCTGCSTTCMKPCTTYVQQARQVPYTTYKMVCETRYVAVTTNSCCPTCPTGCPTGCPTSACATGNCATGNCPTGNCATAYDPGVNGQVTDQPTIELQESKKPANSDNGVTDGIGLERTDDEKLESNDDRNKMAALGTLHAVHRISLSQPQPAAKPLSDDGWVASSR